MSREVRLEVQGMTCGHCQASVQRSLESVPGVTNVEVSVDSAAATATVADGVSLADLKHAVTTAGYQTGDES